VYIFFLPWTILYGIFSVYCECSDAETVAHRPKIICSPSYLDFRSRANAAMWLDLDHMAREEHMQEI
jgi:hypothetical protein